MASMNIKFSCCSNVARIVVLQSRAIICPRGGSSASDVCNVDGAVFRWLLLIHDVKPFAGKGIHQMRIASLTRSKASKRNQRTGSRFCPSFEPLEERKVLAAFSAGNIAVLRIGSSDDLAPDLAFVPTATFIDEYQPDGTFVQEIPFSTSGANALTETGTGFTDGGLTRSDNGQFLLASGYRADEGVGLGPASLSAASTPRRHRPGRRQWQHRRDHRAGRRL